MELQQKLAFQAKKNVTEETQDDIDLFVGAVSPILDPFNLFLRVKDIEKGSDSEFVYFYVYSIGKSKVILWGIYDKMSEEFQIDDACQYDVKYLSDTLKLWQKNGYKYISNQTKNRFGKKIALNMVYDRPNEAEHIFNQYKNSIISRSTEDTEKLEKIIKNIRYGYAETDYISPRTHAVDVARQNGLDKNLAQLYLFILFFIDENEYRACKYMTVLSQTYKKIDKEMKQNMELYIKNSFIRAWFNRITEDTELQLDMAESIVDIFERGMNYTDVNKKVDDMTSVDLINHISLSFINFIAKSEYSKRTFVKKLKPCYTPDQCEDIDCPIFDHGHTIFSTYEYDLK